MSASQSPPCYSQTFGRHRSHFPTTWNHGYHSSTWIYLWVFRGQTSFSLWTSAMRSRRNSCFLSSLTSVSFALRMHMGYLLIAQSSFLKSFYASFCWSSAASRWFATNFRTICSDFFVLVISHSLWLGWGGVTIALRKEPHSSDRDSVARNVASKVWLAGLAAFEVRSAGPDSDRQSGSLRRQSGRGRRTFESRLTCQ